MKPSIQTLVAVAVGLVALWAVRHRPHRRRLPPRGLLDGPQPRPVSDHEVKYLAANCQG